MGRRVVFLRAAPELSRPGHHPRNPHPSMNIGYGAAVAESLGLEADVVDAVALPPGSELRALLAAASPDAVVCDVTTPAVAATAAAVRRAAVPVIAMGQHPSALPLSLLEGGGFDACVVGEPERTLAEALPAALDGGSDALAGLPGLVARTPDGAVAGPARPPIEPLDSLPFPAHELITGPYRTHYPVRSRRRLRFGFVESGRGCPHACLFCSQTLRNTYGDRVRLREPGAVALEVGHLADRLGVNAVVFQDDTFCLDHGFAHALCDELVARGLAERVAWVVQTRVDAVDEDLLGHMRAAGCTTVCFGVESASQRVLDALRKGVTVDQTREAFRAARAAGLLTVGYFMLGCPGETREEAESTLALCHELEPDFVQVAFFTAYPGSPAWAEGHGDQPFERYTHYNAVVRNASAMDEAELGALHRRFYRSYLSSPRFIARYAANRLPVALANWRDEAALARSALGFLAGPGRRGR